jgi:hypothetical protein
MMLDQTAIDPMTPSTTIASPRSLLLFIARRWEYWGPWTLFASASQQPSVDFRAVHYARVHVLVARHVPWRRIRERNLDDPRPPDAEWLARLERYEAQAAPRKGAKLAHKE